MDPKVCNKGCKCRRRGKHQRPWLQYFVTVPNYGQTMKPPFGGSREPFGYLQFILDFWDNLPPVVIFTQVPLLEFASVSEHLSATPTDVSRRTLPLRTTAWLVAACGDNCFHRLQIGCTTGNTSGDPTRRSTPKIASASLSPKTSERAQSLYLALISRARASSLTQTTALSRRSADSYRNRGYFWYKWMAFAQEHVFGVSLENRSTRVT